MEVKETLDIIKVIAQVGSISVIPLFGIIVSQFRGRERIMNQNKEKWGRWISNVFFFILTVFIIDLILLVSVMELFLNENISLKEIGLYKAEIGQVVILFTIFSVLYTFFLMPLWTKEKKYFEVELEHVKGEKERYIVLNRSKEKDKDVLFYKDRNKEYEEDIDTIKQREGRITFIPNKKSIFNINKEAIEGSKILPIWSRWIFFVLIVFVSVFGMWNGLQVMYGVWDFNFGSSLIGFKIVISSFPFVVCIYFIIILIYLYKNWLGKNRIAYKRKKD